LGYPKSNLEQVRFGTLGVLNLTMFQINIGTFGSWPKSNLEQVGFGTLGVLNLTMFQINIGTFGSWLGFEYVMPNPTMYQTCLC
jgi:hypothetical protein